MQHLAVNTAYISTHRDLVQVLRTSPSIRPHLFSYHEFSSPFVLSEEWQKEQFTEGGRSVGRTARGSEARVVFVVVDSSDLQYSAPTSDSAQVFFFGTIGTNQNLCT